MEIDLAILLSNLSGIAYVCENDENWTTSFLSEGCKELTGYEKEELLHNNNLSYVDLIHPNYREYVQKEIQQAHRERQAFEIEYKIISAGGKEKWVREQGQGIFNNRGELDSVQGFITSVSEYKETEGLLKEENRWLSVLFKTQISPVVRLDNKNRILEVNQKFEEVFKYKAEEIKGKDLDDILETAKTSAIDRGATRKFLQGNEVLMEGIRYTRDGEAVECIIKAVPVLVGGKLIGGYAVYIDITRQKESEQELKEKNEELEASYQELSASHQEITAMNEELNESMQKINQLNKRFVNMIDVVSSLDKNGQNRDNSFLSELLQMAIEIVPEAELGKICVLEEEDNTFRFISAVGHDIELLKELRLDAKHFYHLEKGGIYTSEEYSLSLLDLEPEEKRIIEKALKPVRDSIYINIVSEDRTIGRICLDIAEDSDHESFSPGTEKLLESFASLASAFFSFQRYNLLQGQLIEEFVSSVIQILELYDRYTSGHSENVARIAQETARVMDLDDDEIEAAYWTGMVHDIGKLLIPREILNKKGPLTDEEYELIKKHSYWSYKSLSKSSLLGNIAHYVLYHHERWDGRGYPDGLKGEEIPLVSQILALADSWDAMTSKRSYRDPLSEEKALQELKDNKGTQFSPAVVDAFMEYFRKTEPIIEVAKK